MRKKGFILFFFFAPLVLAFSSVSSQEILVRMHLPPEGRFTTEDIYQMVMLTNTGFEAVPVYLRATVNIEKDNELIFEGETSGFMVDPGTMTVSPDNVESLEIIHSDPDYEGLLIQTGSVPAGIYIICAEVIHRETGEMLSKDCVEHEVFHPSMPQLLMPADGVSLYEEYPLFNWLPPMPVPSERAISYRLKVVEILGAQNPYEAMESNPAWYIDEELLAPQMVYPMDARSFEPGMAYAWQVQALDQNGIPVGENDGKSEIFIFSKEILTDNYIRVISPVVPCVGSIDETGYHTSDVLDVQWEFTGNFTQFEVIVYDNPCGRHPGPPPPTPTPPGPAGTPTPPTGRPGTPVTPTPGTPTPTPQPPVPPTPGTPVTPTPETPVPVPTPTEPVPVDDTAPVPTPAEPVPADGTAPLPTPTEPAPGDDDLGGDEGLPPLPPGWEWGPSGPYWTGEHPPEPPDLPPGWEWGPLRPVWTGEGEPPPRVIRGTSQPVYTTPVIISAGEPAYESVSVNIADLVEPGEAFIYQVYGTGEDENGEEIAMLSEAQCMRYMQTGDDGIISEPVPCPGMFVCEIRIEEKAEPKMDGGLDPPEQKHTIYRDEFVPLKAEGKDFDQFWWYCEPIKPCPDTHSSEMRPLTGRVRYTWEIIKGEGDLVDLGCISKKRNTDGIRTIFMPPYVEIDSLRETEIKLTIIDDNKTQPLDSDVVRNIIITTKRTKADPDRYNIEIKSGKYQLPQPVQITGLPVGTCMRRGPKWEEDKDLKDPPTIKLPEVPDNDKIVYKEWIRLEASDIRDPDKVTVWCESKNCLTSDAKRTYEDEVEWTWKILSGGGQFITGNTGRFVIYEAPENEGEVEIQVEAFNNTPLQIVDEKSPPGKIKFKVFQPGVKLELTPLSWLPEDKKTLQKKSYLVHKEGDEWKPAFAHQCRIHFFEMVSYSTEKGICLNWPVTAKADQCPDLAIKKTDAYEAYDTLTCRKNNETDSLYHRKARTKLPEKEFTITINCEDYGAYGFMRSLANGSKSVESPYKSVPWKKSEVPHPDGREKKEEYNDNRVTIPRDCDENKIADNGWTSSLQDIINPVIAALTGRGVRSSKESDPVNPLIDIDRLPSSNNEGDGISGYEEYRGFFVKGKHNRFQMSLKDLLIHDRNNITLGFFRQTGVNAHLINRNEFDPLRVINKNSGVHHLPFEQHGLLLVDASGDVDLGDDYGWARGGPGSPGTIDSIMLNVTQINTDGISLGNCIAHELSHGIDVWHHGEGYLIGRVSPGDSVMIDGAWRKNTSLKVRVYKIIAGNKGVTSGDEDCWMRYDDYARYCAITPALKAVDCSAGNQTRNLSELSIVSRNDNVFGTKLTNTVNGTGVNSGGNCGQNAADIQCGSNAANRRGKCLDQMKITDR